MKCEKCDALPVVHITDLADSGSGTRSLCEAHAREAGLLVPTEVTPAAVVSQLKLLADFLRTHGRMPTSDDWGGADVSMGPPVLGTEDDIDAYLIYIDSFVGFVEKHGRLPCDDELEEPF